MKMLFGYQDTFEVVANVGQEIPANVGRDEEVTRLSTLYRQ